MSLKKRTSKQEPVETWGEIKPTRYNKITRRIA